MELCERESGEKKFHQRAAKKIYEDIVFLLVHFSLIQKKMKSDWQHLKFKWRKGSFEYVSLWFQKLRFELSLISWTVHLEKKNLFKIILINKSETRTSWASSTSSVASSRVTSSSRPVSPAFSRSFGVFFIISRAFQCQRKYMVCSRHHNMGTIQNGLGSARFRDVPVDGGAVRGRIRAHVRQGKIAISAIMNHYFTIRVVRSPMIWVQKTIQQRIFSNDY